MTSRGLGRFVGSLTSVILIASMMICTIYVVLLTRIIKFIDLTRYPKNSLDNIIFDVFFYRFLEKFTRV